jgi:pyrroloquinoline quinone biosynthesis protein D
VSVEPSPGARPRLSRKAVFRRDKVRDADLLLLPERILKLNQTGSAIIRRCNGIRTIAEIAGELEVEFHRTGLRGEVEAFLGRMADQGAIEV